VPADRANQPAAPLAWEDLAAAGLK
jgi:hypothetical protein